MRITIPPATNEEVRFESEFDIFRRKDYGERLANLIENTDGSPVFAIDSAWGEGKTTFLKMWIKHLNERETTSIYFDAFANDYQQDPFMAIASEIYGLIPPDQNAEQKKFTTNLLNAGYAFARGALDVGAKLSTGGAVGLDVITTMVEDYKGRSGKEVIEQSFIDRLKFAAADRQSLEDFKTYLTEFAGTFGKGKPIVFIVDELDRCRPDFALELLEKIKHLFSVDGITFLLVTNRAQLDEFIRIKYGPSVNATNYLHKFINLWLALPKSNNKLDDHGVKYFMYAFPKVLGGLEISDVGHVAECFKAIITHYRPSYREVERMLSIYAVFVNTCNSILQSDQYSTLVTIICYIKSCRRDILGLIKQKDLDAVLVALDMSKTAEHAYAHIMGFIANLIRYDLGDLETKNDVRQQIFGNNVFRMQENVIQNLLSNFISIKQS